MLTVMTPHSLLGRPQSLCLDTPFGKAGLAGAAGFYAIRIERLADFLAGLENGDAFRDDGHAFPGARIATDTRPAVLGRESTEASDLHATTLGEGVHDGIEHGLDRRL